MKPKPPVALERKGCLAMGILYDLPVPIIPGDPNGQFLLVRWLVTEHQKLQSGTPVAVIESKQGRYKILANGDGFFWNKFARLGQKLKSGDKIAVIGSEGEDVPYGKHYSLAEA